MIQQAQIKTEKYSQEMKLQKEEFVEIQSCFDSRKPSLRRKTMLQRRRDVHFFTN